MDKLSPLPAWRNASQKGKECLGRQAAVRRHGRPTQSFTSGRNLDGANISEETDRPPGRSGIR